VLSATSGRVDRIVKGREYAKVREYAAVPSMRRYVILEPTSVGASVMERSEPNQAWQTTVLTNADILRMPELGIETPVAELYEDIVFPDQDEASN
jgi:hypothetical protein